MVFKVIFSFLSQDCGKAKELMWTGSEQQWCQQWCLIHYNHMKIYLDY